MTTTVPSSRSGIMNVSLLLRVNAIVAGLFGIGFLVAPAAFGSAYGAGVTATTELALRYFGAALLVIGTVSWFAGAAAASPLRLWIVRVFAIYAALGLLLDFTGMSSAVIGATGWVNVVIDVAFLVGFGYYGFVKTETA